MCKFFCIAFLASGLALAHPDPVYQPLAFLAEHCWKGTFPNSTQTDEHCFTWVYDGKFLRDRHTVRTPGKPDALGESIYYADTSTKQLEYLYFESDGGHSRGSVSIEKDALVFPDTSFVEGGKTMVYRSRWQLSGNDAYEVLTEFKVKEAWVPGFKVHMEQIPDAK
jgi:hypothetical protein